MISDTVVAADDDTGFPWRAGTKNDRRLSANPGQIYSGVAG
jgi:hypothetical protein